MTAVQDNKYNYFYFRVTLPYEDLDLSEIDDNLLMLEDYMDRTLKDFSVDDEWYHLENIDGLSHAWCFKTEMRKRVSNLQKVFERSFNIPYHSFKLDKSSMEEFYSSIESLPNKQHWKVIRAPQNNHVYKGSDLTVFSDPNNLYPWQKNLYNILFDDENKIKSDDNRSITCIVDIDGNKGKSSFIKYLCWTQISSIAKLSYASSTQLRSGLVQMGPKSVYIVDLPRTKGVGDKIEDLISVIEELKNGFVTSFMYGKSRTLMINPPFVIVFSNEHLPYHLLSTDRWRCYEIQQDSSNPKLNPINLKLRAAKAKVTSAAKK